MPFPTSAVILAIDSQHEVMLFITVVALLCLLHLQSAPPCKFHHTVLMPCRRFAAMPTVHPALLALQGGSGKRSYGGTSRCQLPESSVENRRRIEFDSVLCSTVSYCTVLYFPVVPGPVIDAAPLREEGAAKVVGGDRDSRMLGSRASSLNNLILCRRWSQLATNSAAPQTQDTVRTPAQVEQPCR